MPEKEKEQNKAQMVYCNYSAGDCRENEALEDISNRKIRRYVVFTQRSQ